MPIEPIYEKINLNNRKKYFSEPNKCQVKTTVATGEIKEVLSINATAGVFGSETTNNQVTFNGKTVFYVCYVDSQGQVCKIETSGDFSGVVKNESIKEGFKCILSPQVIKTEYDMSGVLLSLSATLSVCVETVENVEFSALVGGEGLVLDNQDVEMCVSLGIKESAYPIEEEFELNYPVKEVLYHRASAVITATQCGISSIIVDGKVFLTIIALQNQEKYAIIKETRTVPFRMEIECEDAMPTMLATAKVYEKALKTQVEVDEETKKSKVLVSLNLYFAGEVFSNQTLTICKDAFSTKENLSLQMENCLLAKPFEPVFSSEKVNGRANTEELPIGVRLLAVGGEKAEIVSVDKLDVGLRLTGITSATCYFADGEGVVFTRKVETPFERVFELNIPLEQVDVDFTTKCENSSARLVSATEVELETEINLTVYAEQKSTVKCIKEVATTGEKIENPHAISVYIPMENEELWSLSKRLNVCPETLVTTNPELTFPLTGKERIVVYRQR